jgi:hypothetical protein
MIEPTSHPTPNWELIFKRRPDLSPPGYREAEVALQDQKIEPNPRGSDS